MSEKSKVILCPYCGNTQAEPQDRCAVCAGYFDQLSLKVTQQNMGPWFIRDRQNPFRPGCSYEVLTKQIEKGKITANTILRGPTTRQYWSVARNVPGVAHLLGYCHQCGAHVKQDDHTCPKCNASFTPSMVRDQLGLAPIDPNLNKVVEAVRSGAISGKSSAGNASGKFTLGSGGSTAGGLGGSAILRTLRDDSAGAAPGTTAKPQVPSLTPQTAAASRDAGDWLTGKPGEQPDSIDSAGKSLYQTEERSGFSAMTWVLIVMNLLLVIAVVGVIIYVATRGPQQPNQPTTTGGSTPTTQNEGDTTSELDTGLDSDPGDAVNGEGQTPTPTPPTPAVNTTDNGGATPPPDASTVTPPTPAVSSTWQRMYEQAIALEQAGDLNRAYQMLQRIESEAPEAQQPDSLETDKIRVRDKINQKQLEDFFG